MKAALDENRIVLIRVRTPDEYGFEHIPGALLFPMSNFDPGKLPEQVNRRIIFHCSSGMWSHAIAKRCANAAIQPLAHMEGGLAGWKAAREPNMGIDPATGSLVMKTA